MNDNWKDRSTELAMQQYDNLELRKKLTRIQNMSMLCHRSGEIDQGTLLYFSVNDMYLGDKDFFVLLFSEISPPRPMQEAGRDVHGQMFTYAIIEEVVKECFSGHYTFYSSELDGRLVVIVCFLYGLLPDEPDVHMLYPTCEEVAEKCRERFGMNVVAYISKASNNISTVAILYHKLLNLATLHRYTEKKFDSPVVITSPIPIEEGSAAPALPISESAKDLANAMLNQDDYHAIADDMLTRISTFHANSAEDLKVRFGNYFDCICSELLLRGVKLKVAKMNEEQLKLLGESKYWRDITDWLHHTLDSIANERRKVHQELLRQKLKAVQQYIDANIQNANLSVEEISEAADMNASFLSTAFKQQLQITPTSYIRKKRLEKSLELLKSGKLKISEISEQCGFGSVETFHRSFKSEYGSSPARIRREIANTNLS